MRWVDFVSRIRENLKAVPGDSTDLIKTREELSYKSTSVTAAFQEDKNSYIWSICEAITYTRRRSLDWDKQRWKKTEYLRKEKHFAEYMVQHATEDSGGRGTIEN
jgi:predicted metal-binding transcription factor (methanogenesis marker protein 9)